MAQCPNKEHSRKRVTEEKRRGEVGRWERGQRRNDNTRRQGAQQCEAQLLMGWGAAQAQPLPIPTPSQTRSVPRSPVSAHQILELTQGFLLTEHTYYVSTVCISLTTFNFRSKARGGENLKIIMHMYILCKCVYIHSSFLKFTIYRKVCKS